MKMKVQADAIRIAILKKYGGIWMDADTIVTNSHLIKRFYDYKYDTNRLSKDSNIFPSNFPQDSINKENFNEESIKRKIPKGTPYVLFYKKGK